jgi:hypothetical protein
VHFVHRLTSKSVFIFLCSFTFCLTSFAQSFREQFDSLLGTRDTVALEQILKNWEKKNPDDPELFTSWFNFYIVKGRKEINADMKHDSSFVLKDSTGKAIYYVCGEYYYVEKTIAEGFKTLDKGIKKHPLRLDMYFGKAWLLGDLGKTKEQTAVILNVIELSVKNNKPMAVDEQSTAGRRKTFSIEKYPKLHCKNAGRSAAGQCAKSSRRNIESLPRPC